VDIELFSEEKLIKVEVIKVPFNENIYKG